MNLFEINYLEKMSALLKEAFRFKKYKAMSKPLAVFCGILMIPFVASSFIATALLALLCFGFSVVAAPVKFLHSMVNTEGKEVKHATQFVIYLISWPMIFLCYAFMSFLLILITPLYALLSILLYVWSFGGFKFHLFMTDAEQISIEVKGRYRSLPLVFLLISILILLLIPIIHAIFVYIDLYKYYMETFFFEIFFGSVYPVYIRIHSLFALLFSLIGMARNPKEEAPIEVPPVPVTEAPLPAVETSDLPTENTETPNVEE